MAPADSLVLKLRPFYRTGKFPRYLYEYSTIPPRAGGEQGVHLLVPFELRYTTKLFYDGQCMYQSTLYDGCFVFGPVGS